MKKLQDLVMDFEVAMAYMKDGGPQDTLYSWFGDPDKNDSVTGEIYIWIARTEPVNQLDVERRRDLWPECGKPLCAAPIVASELPNLSIKPAPASPWRKINGPEDLPNSSGQYVVKLIRGGDFRAAWYNHLNEYTQAYWVAQFTHWMPIPDAPEEGGEG